MKIRIIGTKSECETAKTYYSSLRNNPSTKYVTVSKFCPCRCSSGLYRVYIKIEYYEAIDNQEEPKQVGNKKLDLRTINNAHLSAKGIDV